VLGQLGNAAHPSEESSQGGPHRKNEHMVMCGRPKGNRDGGGGRWLTVRGGRTRWHGARGVVESAEQRLERAFHGGACRVWRSNDDGLEGLSGLELEGL
jgi:hypothetical protein